MTYFAIGSDTNGLYEAGGMFSLLNTYNYELDADTILGNFEIYSLFYGIMTSEQPAIVSAPSTNSTGPVFRAVTGSGFLSNFGASGTLPYSSNIWITNYSASTVSNSVVTITFAIAGGSNGFAYDVFASSGVTNFSTNGVWYWMGQGGRATNFSIAITNIPTTGIYLVLGQPTDTDQDGLTDAYEKLVSRTNPYNADSDYDGISDGHEVVNGTNPLLASSVSSQLLASWSFDNTNTWVGDQGQSPITASNLFGIASWSTNAVQIGSVSNALLNYPEAQAYGSANINCRSGTVSFWFKPLWNSGTGPGSNGRFLEIGSELAGGWWGIVASSNGTTLSLITETNSVETANANAPINWTYTGWHQVVVTYSPTNSSIYLDGAPVVTNGMGITRYPAASLRALGLRVGSDINGSQQINGTVERLFSYNYPLTASAISSNYSADALLLPVDLDFDGLNAVAEAAAGTSPTSPDTDGDGLSDWYEINVSHTNPLTPQAVPALTDRPINRCPVN